MRLFFVILSLSLALVFSLTHCASSMNFSHDKLWKGEVDKELALLGARNWIVIAEPSFSSLSGPGAKTVATDVSSPEALFYVLDKLDALSHTEPRVQLPLEMNYVGEDYAPGMKKFREQINKLLLGRNVQEAQHETLRRLMLDAAKNYNVLIVKTTTALPFSNIFIELDSGYWNSDSERQLQQKINTSLKKDASSGDAKAVSDALKIAI